MKMQALRTLLLVTLFVIVVMATYFALIPDSFFHSQSNRNRNYTLFLKSKEAFTHPLSDKPSTIDAAGLSSKGKSEVTPSSKKGSSRPSQKVGELVVANSQASIDLAKEIFRKKGVVLFTMINDAFFDFAASWCCNTAHFGDIHQHVLFLTTDIHTGQSLQSLFSNLSVIAMENVQFGGPQEYSKAGYVRMMVERTRYILRLLEAGVQILLFEVDCLWLRDPLPLLLSRQSEGDILATKVSGQTVTAGGFLLLNPTKATVQLWKELTRMMDELFNMLKPKKSSTSVSEGTNDQMFFSSLINKKYAGIKVVYLPADTFPDGKWYSLHKEQRLASQPIIINNNWLVGNDAKRQRAKTFGHWFWDKSSKRCNASAVHNLFH